MKGEKKEEIFERKEGIKKGTSKIRKFPEKILEEGIRKQVKNKIKETWEGERRLIKLLKKIGFGEHIIKEREFQRLIGEDGVKIRVESKKITEKDNETEIKVKIIIRKSKDKNYTYNATITINKIGRKEVESYSSDLYLGRLAERLFEVYETTTSRWDYSSGKRKRKRRLYKEKEEFLKLKFRETLTLIKELEEYWIEKKELERIEKEIAHQIQEGKLEVDTYVYAERMEKKIDITVYNGRKPIGLYLITLKITRGRNKI